MSLDQFKQEHQWLKTQRQPYDEIIEDIQKLVLPWRGDVTTEFDPDYDRVSSAFDATGVNALDALTSYLSGSIFPPSDGWLRMVGGPSDDKDTRDRMDEASDEMLAALDDSNFYVTMGTWFKDLAGIGNACLLVQPREERLRPGGSLFGGVDFEAVPFAKFWRHLDRNRRTLMLSREFKMMPIESNRFFIAHKLSGNEETTFVNLVKPNKDDTGWVSYWWAKDGEKLIQTDELAIMPYVPGVWDMTDGQNYGYGRGHLVRSTIAGMQELARQTYQAVGRDLNPLLAVEHDSFMNMDAGGNGIVTLKRSITRDPFFLTSGSNFAAADNIRRLDREQVNIAFFADALLEPETQTRSAEADRSKNARLAVRMAGPSQGIARHLATIMETLASMMRASGGLKSLDGIGDVKFVFQSPFFTALKQATADRVSNFVAEQAQLASLLQKEEIMDPIDLEQAAAVIADNSDIPSRVIRGEESLTNIKKQRAQVAAEQRSNEAAQAGNVPQEQGLESTLALERNLPQVG